MTTDRRVEVSERTLADVLSLVDRVLVDPAVAGEDSFATALRGATTALRVDSRVLASA